jgi:hypothetical protein
VPDRYVEAPGVGANERAWTALGVPVEVAFFLKNSAKDRVAAFYPSPAGATESELPLESWTELTRTEPVIATMSPDVEALLVRRWLDGTLRAFIVPIDVCYELVGRIRRAWRGMQGGDDLWRDVEDFFARIVARARESAA